MIELISIHIPKTAGTSFHKVLTDLYGDQVSPSFKRVDLPALMDEYGQLRSQAVSEYRIIHGHFRFYEISQVHKESKAPVICWLRHPADRVISNYRFFIDRLANPEINPQVSSLNRHRINEQLLEYAQLTENRNRMSYFLDGITIPELLFCGLQEWFEEDLRTLAKKLSWPEFKTPRLNSSDNVSSIDPDLYKEICTLNEIDMDLYNQAQFLRDANLKKLS